MHILAFSAGLGGCLSLLTLIGIGVGVVVALVIAASKGREAAEAEARRAELEPKPPPLPKPGYCRGCGVFLRQFGKCESSIRLQVDPLEFDPASGKRWYVNVRGATDYLAFCVEREHTHSVTKGYNDFCSCTDGLSPRRGGHDFIFRILGPKIVDEKYAQLRGTCGKDFCGSCGIDEPTVSKV